MRAGDAKLHYRDLGKAAGLDRDLSGYPEKPLEVYFEDNYEKALQRRNLEDIVNFLKEWRVRVKIDRRKLDRAIERKRLLLNQLRKRRINIVSVNLTDARLYDTVVELFDILSKVSVGRKTYTGASKILHVLVPDLFVMWDDTIRCAYGCRSRKEGDDGEKYFSFLKRVQLEAKEAIESYRSEHICTDEEAIRRIRLELYEEGFYPFTRLIDIYNFQKYTLGKDEMWSH